MAQSVIVKRAEKINDVFLAIGFDCSEQEFISKFKEMFPSDWDRVVKRFKDHEAKDIKKKGHPMPRPDIYVRNMYNVGKKRNQQNG